MDFEDVLEEVGDFGPFQKKRVLILMLSALLVPMYCMTTIFMVSSPSHWCKVNQLSNFSFEDQKQLISPVRVEDGVTKHDSCLMFDLDYDYLAKVGNISTYKSHLNITSELLVKSCDNGWTYDNSYYDETAVTALDLVCDHSHYVSLILSTSSIGTIIGTPLLGWLSDRIGRLKTFKITIFICILSSLSPTFFRNLTSFIIFRIIGGLILPSFYQLPYLICLEMVGPRARTLINAVACFSWVGGLCILSFMAYITRHWVWFNVITSSTVLIFFFIWRFLPESPRWLIINEKYSEAVDLIQRIAKTNGKPIPQDLEQKLRKVGKKLTSNDTEEISNAVWVFIKNPGLRNNITLVTLNWMSCAAVYFGIHLNLYNLSGNEFLNFFLLSIIELPAYISATFCIETRLGRRWSGALFLVLCGLSLCITAVVPKSMLYLTNGMTLLGKFCGTLCFMIIYQQAAELYPTAIRNQGMGVGAMASSLVGIAMPYVVFGTSDIWVSLTILGSISIAVGLISSFIPETLNVNLPQTISEANIFGKNQKYFSWANTKSISKIDEKPDINGVVVLKTMDSIKK